MREIRSVILSLICLTFVMACQKNPLPPNGVVISQNSTIAFAPGELDSSLSTCTATPLFSISIDNATMSGNLEFELNFQPTTNQQYNLQTPDGNFGIATRNNSQWIEITSWGIDVSAAVIPSTSFGNYSHDQIVAASITFLAAPSLVGDSALAFSFSVTYADGKILAGTVNTTMQTSSSQICGTADKPVIYLYPKKSTEVLVQLDFQGTLGTTYPDYNAMIKGWKVRAEADGRLTDLKDGREYSYLFWDGTPFEPISEEDGRGFLVAGNHTKSFLQETLAKMGLTPREYNEFIVYWLPKMQRNAYNFIRFAGNSYTKVAKLEVTPKPDSVLRVFMTFRSLPDPQGFKPLPQKIPSFHRKGFTVVEWGGSELPNPLSVNRLVRR